MRTQLRFLVALLAVWGLLLGVAPKAVFAQQKTSPPKPQTYQTATNEEAKQLLTLMDTDNDGQVSKQEFMRFMDSEFDRLDKDKSGQLDLLELGQLQLRGHPFAHAGK